MMTLWMLSAVLAKDTTRPARAATPSCPEGEHYERNSDGELACLPILPVSQPAGAAAPPPLSGSPEQRPLYKGVYLDNTMSPIILGALDKALIHQVMKTTGEALHACYLPRLAERPTLEGRVTVKFVIARDGTVSSATIKSIDDALRDEALAVCALNTIRGLKFPKPEGGGMVIVSYPFFFDASEATAP